MKKIFRTALCAILALFLLLPNFAAAAQFTDEADSLASLGLFKGTNKGYELDRVPTRAEAAVMLVRFLGKEKEALGLTWRAPFTDVPDWAKSYVQYLYENKLTSGTSDTTYTPDGNCSAQMYATFLLRALGYSDAKGDFSYSDAINYAKLKKIINEKNYDENGFLRDHMVSMSYCALGLSTADGKYTSLIRRLAADGAVTNAQAEAFLAEYAQRYGDGVGYLKKYSDYDAAAEWIRTNIDGTDAPPVSFTLGGRSSSSMKWTKSAGKEQTVVDYAESERPAERRVREIVYECAAEKLRVRLTLTTYPDYPVVEYGAHIDNLASVPTGTVRDFMSVNGSIAKADGRTVLHYNQGSHGYAETEYQPFTRTLSQSAFRLAVSNGMPTCEFLPYFNAEDQNGGGVIAAVVWQGGWEASFSAADGNVRLSAGQNGAGFCMKGGESFKFPGIVLLFYKDGDWQEGQNVWRRWVVEHNLMRNTGRRDFTQNVFVCSGFPGADRDISSVNAFAKSGAAKLYNCVFELDAGWYDPGLSNWGYTGNWTRMASGYENGGLKKVSDACHKNGMSFCMWFEPERLYSGTDFAKTLGNSVIYLDGSGNYVPYGSTGGSEYQGLINYGDRKAEDAVVALLDRAINDYGIDVYRQDFNTSNAPYWSAYDRYESSALGYARSGATENHACEGYINAWTRLEELHPGLVFDACAGGGRRYDLETMRFAFVHTKSDYWAEPRSQQCQNLGMYSWNIFTGTGFTDAGSYDVRTRLTLSVGIGAGADAGTLGALKEWASMQKYMMCDYYALTGYSLSETANIAMQFNSPEQGGGMAVAYLRAGGAFTLKLRGLDAKAKYRVWDTDASGYIVATGETLMNGGCKLSRGKGSASAAVIYYEKTSESVQGGVNLSSGVDFESLSVQTNDEAAIKALAAKAEVGENGAMFLCSDHDGSGGIYLIGETLYSKLVKSGQKNSEGWTKLDPDKNGIYVDRVYPLGTWGEGGAFDLRAYVKSLGGKKLLWLDNSYGLGDADGGWTNGARRLCVLDGSGNTSYSSDKFEFHVCGYKTLGGRDMQFSCFDGKSAVYSLSERMYKALPLSANKKTVHGIEWTEIRPDSVYFERAFNDCAHNADDPSLYDTVTLSNLVNTADVRLYAAQKGGKYWLYAENGCSIGDRYASDRWQMYFPCDGVLRHFEVYFVTGSARSNVYSLIKDVKTPW